MRGFNKSKSLHAGYVGVIQGAGLKTPKLVICSRIAASLCMIDLIVSDWSPIKQPEMLLKRSISSRILLSHSLAPTRSSVDLICYHVDDGCHGRERRTHRGSSADGRTLCSVCGSAQHVFSLFEAAVAVSVDTPPVSASRPLPPVEVALGFVVDLLDPAQIEPQCQPYHDLGSGGRARI